MIRAQVAQNLHAVCLELSGCPGTPDGLVSVSKLNLVPLQGGRPRPGGSSVKLGVAGQ